MICRVLILVTFRIVKFFTVGVRYDIIVGLLSIVDSWLCDDYISSFYFWRNVFDNHPREPLVVYIVYRGYDDTNAMGVYQVFIDPRVCSTLQSTRKDFSEGHPHLG